jgi:predicted membrane protein
MPLTREKEKETILTICVGLLVIYLITKMHYPLLVYAAVVLGLTGMFSVFLTSKIANAWMKMAEGIGFVMSKVILSFIFFFILVPFAWLSRFKKRDNLILKKKDSGTYYVDRNHTYTSEDLKQMW